MSHITTVGAAVVVLMSLPVAAPAQDALHPAVRDVAGELACGPQAAFTVPVPTLRIAGSSEVKRALFGIDDSVVISGGTSQGVKPGQLYFVRRAVADRFTAPMSDGLRITSIHTAGWVRIVEAQADAAIAIITQACDGIETGDYLEPFDLPVVPPTAAPGEPDYSAPGHLILGDDRRQIGGTGSLMVLDRGTDHGLKPGQRLTIYRETIGGRGPVSRVGEATALIVNAETALVRIESSRGAVYVGDLVALHR